MRHIQSLFLIWLLTCIRILERVNGQTILSTTEYCEVCAQHSMCIYSGVGPQCGVPITRLLSNEERWKILEAHNNLRNRIALGLVTAGNPGPQPPAADMRKMAWDYELEAVAQRWADQCKFSHDECRKLVNLKAGQNLAITSTLDQKLNMTQDWVARIYHAWFGNEVQMFSKFDVEPFKSLAAYGHYTQMIWSRTYLVGCGYIQFNEGKFVKKLYVCNYAPAGNIVDSYMYKVGPACSQCPNNMTCKDTVNKGLCE